MYTLRASEKETEYGHLFCCIALFIQFIAGDGLAEPTNLVVRSPHDLGKRLSLYGIIFRSRYYGTYRMAAVKRILNFSLLFLIISELMDYPESDEEGTSQQDAMATANSILDTDDADMADGTGAEENLHSRSTSAGPMARDRQPGYGTHRAGDSCHFGKRSAPGSSSSGGNMMNAENVPDLPPIYMTVRKEREKKMTTRHLSGGESNGAVGTSRGATVSQVEVIGSFANAGDKRHNHTMHRFDFQNLRNLSTSFNTSNLMCTTCQEEHRVLRREIEGVEMWGMTILRSLSLPIRISPRWSLRGGEGNGTVLA
jgi:hypothetical protein